MAQWSTEIQEGLIVKQELCNALDLSIKTIDNYIGQGMPVAIRGSKGRPHQFDLEQCKVWIAANVRGQGGTENDENLNEAKLRKLQAEASLAEIELQRERAELVEIEEVAKQVASEYSTVRAKLLALPTKVSGIIYSLQSQREVTEVLDNAIREILQELTADN